MKLNVGLDGIHDIFLRKRGSNELVRPEGITGPVHNLITNSGLDLCCTVGTARACYYMVLGNGTTAASVTDTTLESYQNTQTSFGTDSGLTTNTTDKYADVWESHVWINNTGTDVTRYEIGMASESTPNPTIFSRVVFPTGIVIPNGYEIIDKYTLRQYLPWRTPATTTLSFYNSSTGQMEDVGCTYMVVGNPTYANDTDFSYLVNRPQYCDTPGLQFLGKIFDRRTVAGITADTNLPTLSQTVNIGNLTKTTGYTASVTTYVPGSFERTVYYNFTASLYPSTTFYGFVISSYYASGNCYMYCIFDTPKVKGPTRQWSVGMTLSYGRYGE